LLSVTIITSKNFLSKLMFKKLLRKSIKFIVIPAVFVASFLSMTASPAYAAVYLDGVGEVTKSDPDISYMDFGLFDYLGNNLFISGNYAYVVAKSGNAFVVIDISDSDSPNGIADLVTDADFGYGQLYSPLGVYVSGNYAYVAHMAGLAVINISNPANPDGIAEVPYDDPQLCQTTSSAAVYALGNYAYVVGTTALAECFNVFDISDPYNPDGVANFTGDGEVTLWDPSAVYVSGSYAYVTNGDPDTFSVINISNPLIPDGIGEVGPSDPDISNINNPSSIYVSGNYAYVTSKNGNALEVIDISNPASPNGVAEITKDEDSDISNMNGPNSVFVSGNYAYVVAGMGNALVVIDISDPLNPDGVAQIVKGGDTDIPNMTYPHWVYLSGDYAYMTSSGGDALDVIHVTMPPDLSLTALTPDPTSDNTPTFTGTATDDTGTVSSVQYQIDDTGGSWSNCTAIDGAFDEAYESFTCNVGTALSDGEHTIYVRSTDSNLHTTPSGEEATDTFTIDTTVEGTVVTVGGKEVEEGGSVEVDSSKPEFSGTGDAGVLVTIEIDGITGATVVGGDGTWSWSPNEDIPDGEYSVTITFEDELENTSEVTLTLTVRTELAGTGGSGYLLMVIGLLLVAVSFSYGYLIRKQLASSK
jgi:hypothetical protein